MEGKLVEYIYEQSKVDSISDLRSKEVLRLCMHLIEEIQEESFSLSAWLYAYQYFTGKSIYVHTVDDVKKALKKWAI